VTRAHHDEGRRRSGAGVAGERAARGEAAAGQQEAADAKVTAKK